MCVCVCVCVCVGEREREREREDAYGSVHPRSLKKNFPRLLSSQMSQYICAVVTSLYTDFSTFLFRNSPLPPRLLSLLANHCCTFNLYFYFILPPRLLSLLANHCCTFSRLTCVCVCVCVSIHLRIYIHILCVSYTHTHTLTLTHSHIQTTAAQSYIHSHKFVTHRPAPIKQIHSRSNMFRIHPVADGMKVFRV